MPNSSSYLLTLADGRFACKSSVEDDSCILNFSVIVVQAVVTLIINLSITKLEILNTNTAWNKSTNSFV